MAETVFMIHGMWGSPWHWDNYRRIFEAEGYRCIAITLPYHDMDPEDVPDPRLGTASLLDYADALEREIKLLDEKPIVIGHSMGGLLAQILGARGLATALVLISPTSPAGIMAITPSLIYRSWRIHARWGFWKKPMRQTFSEAAYLILNLLPEKEQKEIYSRFVYESGRVACEIFYWFFDSRGASRVNESKVTRPVLVIVGAQDRATPASLVRRIAKKYQAVSTYREFENHAHWILGEPQWQEVAEYVVGWLKSKKNE